MELRIINARTTSVWDQPKLDILGTTGEFQKTIPIHLDWLNYQGALYACQNWHYTGTMPSGKTIKIGLWEAGKFIGCAVYSRGANPSLGRPYNLVQTQICELTRIALRKHQTPVSKLISLSVKLLKRQSPGLRMVISYADTNQGHIGTVYQAANWYYSGEVSSHKIRFGDEILHSRTMNERVRKSNLSYRKYIKASKLEYEKIKGLAMHKYVWPLDEGMLKLAEQLSKPYPKK